MQLAENLGTSCFVYSSFTCLTNLHSLSAKLLNPCLAKWQVLCIFKALQKIDIRKKKSDDENCSHPLTVEEFYHFYEALDFKWIAPVRKNYWIQCILSIYINFSYFTQTNEMNRNCKPIFENIQYYLGKWYPFFSFVVNRCSCYYLLYKI